MHCCSKEKIISRSPNDNIICHICPSKLSKRELEDLYFTLVQNNLDLKRTINQLSDKIKVQTTKLQRMLETQRAYMGTEAKDCCATTKAIVHEQKIVIVDLKKTNEDLQEQVKQLNMKLCSAKQFMGRTPSTLNQKSNSRAKSLSARNEQPSQPAAPKNSSTSALDSKKPEAPKMGVKSVSCQYLVLDSAGSSKKNQKPKTAPNKLLVDKKTVPMPKSSCDENKCKTQMEELKEKIAHLEKELDKTHEEYANRIARLETEVVELHSENMQVRAEKACWEQTISTRTDEANEVKKKLAKAECACEQLNANLNVERNRVTELETQIKAANMTSEHLKAIEERCSNENTNKEARRGSDISNSEKVIDSPDTAGGNYYSTVRGRYREFQESEGFREAFYPDSFKVPHKCGASKYHNNCKPDYLSIQEAEHCCTIHKKSSEALQKNNQVCSPGNSPKEFETQDRCQYETVTQQTKDIHQTQEDPVKSKKKESSDLDKNGNKNNTSQKSCQSWPDAHTKKKKDSSAEIVSTWRDKVSSQRDNSDRSDKLTSEKVKHAGNRFSTETKGKESTSDNDENQNSHTIPNRDNVSKSRPSTNTKQIKKNSNENESARGVCVSKQSDNLGLGDKLISVKVKYSGNSPPDVSKAIENYNFCNDEFNQNLKDINENLNSHDAEYFPQANNNKQIHEDVIKERTKELADTNDHYDFCSTPFQNYVDPGIADTLGKNRKDSATRHVNTLSENAFNNNSCKQNRSDESQNNTVSSPDANIRKNNVTPRENDGSDSSILNQPYTTKLKKDSIELHRESVSNNKNSNKSDKNKLIKNDDVTRSDFTTEYRSKFVDPRRVSQNSCTPSKGEIPPEMSQLVDKSDESSCYCSGQCTCTNSIKNINDVTSPETAVSAYESTKTNKDAAPSPCGLSPMKTSEETAPQCYSTEDENLLQKLLSLFQSPPNISFAIPTEATATPVKSLGETRTPDVNNSAAETSATKTADDSGFTETTKSATSDEGKALLRENQELINKVAELQEQLDKLRVHVLSRKDTFTLLKDNEEENADIDKQSKKCEIKQQPGNDDIKTDIKRVSLKLVPEEHSDEEVNARWQHRSSGPCETSVSCEHTCAKQGLKCTTECRKKDTASAKIFKSDDSNKYVRRKDDDIRYQIPGPLQVTEDKRNTEPDANSEAFDSLNKRVRDSISIQRDHLNNHCFRSKENTNFYQGYIAAENPPPQTGITGNIQRTPSNAQYTREIPNNLKPQIIQANPQVSSNQNTIDPLTTNQDIKNTEVSNVKSLPFSEMRAQMNRDSLTRTKSLTATQCSCHSSKKSVKCMCATYTQNVTNVPHASTVPKTIIQYSENFHNQGQLKDIPKLSNMENGLSSNARQSVVRRPSNKNLNNTHTSTIQIPEHIIPTNTPVNKEALEVPTFEELMDNIDRSEKSVGSERKKSDPFMGIKETTFEKKTLEVEDPSTQEREIVIADKLTSFRKASMFEANKIQRRNSTNQSVNPNDGERSYKTKFDKSRHNSDIIDNCRKSFSKSDKLESGSHKVTDIQEINREEYRFPDYSRKDLNIETKEDRFDPGKMQQENLLNNYFRQPGLTPIANSSPVASGFQANSPKAGPDKRTENQLGTQLSDGAGDKEMEAKTYTIKAFANIEKENEERKGNFSRAASPENTDQEISSMTDLPSEKETTTTPTQSSQCRKYARFSNKLNNATATKSDSATVSSSPSPGENAFSLSEGEMPQYTATPKGRGNSMYIDPRPSLKQKVSDPLAQQKMEEVLANISEQLAKCRELLSKPTETPLPELPKKLHSEEKTDSKKRHSLATPAPSVLALHRSEGRPHIGNGNTPHVMFTLHIGSVVLSDEAVICSRDMSLVLTWKFYDQNVALSHMRPGRVVNFDFSTEYDLKLTDHFLQYLKYEELPIKVCEANNLDVPLASCLLPLREALLHTNRRADLSLVLLAGPQMQRLPRPVADALDTRDEVGVLDLWCMLRAEPNIVPLINKAIVRTRPSTSQGGQLQRMMSPLFMQLDDDQDEVRLSNDLEPTFYGTGQRLPLLDSGNLNDRGGGQEQNDQMRAARKRVSNYGYMDASTGVRTGTNELSPHPQQYNTYPPLKERAFRIGSEHSINTETYSQDVKLSPGSLQTIPRPSKFNYVPKYLDNLKQNSSGLIVNEVPAIIKSDEQMKKVISERSKSLNRRPTIPSPLFDTRKPDQSRARPEHRLSDGQTSIPSVRQRDNPASDDQDFYSLAMGTSLTTLNRYFANKGSIENEKVEKKFQGTTPEESRRQSEDNTIKQRELKAEATKKAMEVFRKIKISQQDIPSAYEQANKYLEKSQEKPNTDYVIGQTVDITILWLALNEECAAMSDSSVQRLYVAYSFLGRSGAELETPNSLPKPKQYQDKCYFNFKKSFQLSDSDVEAVGRLGSCRYPNKGPPNPNDCVAFTVVSEPVEDPLGLNNCEDIGTAHLFFGDLLSYSAGSDTYTDVVPIRDVQGNDTVCGVLAIRVDGLDLVRKCLVEYENAIRPVALSTERHFSQ